MTAPVHHLEMHADSGEITLRLTCTATPDAPCRRRPTNPDAETWTDNDETTPGHDCWAVEWIDNGGWDSITWGPETGTIASVPVDVSYDHRGVLAEPVILPDPADLLPVTAGCPTRPERRWASVARGSRFVGTMGPVLRVRGGGAVIAVSHREAWFPWADLDVVSDEDAYHATPDHAWVDAQPPRDCGCGWREVRP